MSLFAKFHFSLNPANSPDEFPVVDSATVGSVRTSGGTNSEALGELAQAKIRFGMNIALISLAMFAYQHDPSIGLMLSWVTFSLSAFSAVALYIWARLLPRTRSDSKWRVGQRVASIVVDNVVITWILYIGNATLVGAYGIYLWITIGYGMRFGLSYLYGNLIASSVGFTTVALITPFWRENPSMSVGLGLALIVVPIYAGFLIKRLHSAVRQAQAAYAAKSDFVAKVSHELRTPLHGIIAINDLLSRTDATTQQKEMIRIISVSSNTLLDLINRILDISKFEDGTFALQSEPMDLHAVVSDTLSILWPQAHQKNLELRCFVDTALENHFIGSPRQLQEVLINIGGNAIKFTVRGSVSLRILSNPSRAGTVGVRIEICDTGPGISKENLARIFDPFYQADDSITRKHGGTGLGTAIARELVRLMGGEIHVESEFGVGTKFAIDLQFEEEVRPANLATIYPIDVVLIADQPITSSIKSRLSPYGVRVLDSSVLSARLSRGNAPPHAIFIDMDARYEKAVDFKTWIAGISQDMLIPVFGVGVTHKDNTALEHSYNGFVAMDAAPQIFERALNLAATLRKDYSIEIAASASSSKFRVLVAEDNVTNQTIARLALAEAGYDCTIVDNGEAALEQLATDQFDIAIIDMHMPGIDGLEVAKMYNFTHHDPMARIPLVMMTADNRPEVVADADLLGIAKFLVKPIKPSQFIEIINNLIIPKSGNNSELTSRERRDTVAAANATSDLIDEDTVHELLGYMEDQEKTTFFSEFVEDARNYIQSVALVDAANDLDHLRNDMHALCGAARTVGAKRLAVYARKVEYMPADDIKCSSAKIREELGIIVDESERELRRIAQI